MRLTRLQYVAATILGLLIGALCGFLIGKNQGKISERRSEREKEATRFAEGPWGMVRYWDTLLEMPADIISLRSRPMGLTRWYFGMSTAEDIARSLRVCGLEPGLVDRLMAGAQSVQEGGFLLEPTDEMILSLTPKVRASLYATLNQWSQNQAVRDATRFQKMGSKDWLDESSMKQPVVEMVRRLIYRNGDTQLFVDYDVVLRKVADNFEARDFLRTMTRQNCYMGTLVVRPADDIEALTRYWGRGGRERDVRTLLESAKWADTRHEVPLLMLMPRFVRDRLYRYRNANDPELANCHYTAMNFFNTMPTESFTNLADCAKAIDTEYADVAGTNYLLGDVILFMIDKQRVVHSANYVAGHIAFTKNGSSQGQPWVLADITALKNYFGVDEPVTLRFIRRRGFVEEN